MTETVGSNQGPWTMIVVHGVGNASPGSILQEASQGIEGVPGERSDLVLDDCAFPTLELHQHPTIGRLIEVNWSDVASPKQTPLSVADYCVRIVAALLHVATRLPAAGLIGRLYRWLFESALVYCLYPALVAMLLYVTPSQPGKWIIAVASPLAVAGVTWYLKRFGRALSTGFLWAGFMLAGNVSVVRGWLEVSRFVEWATVAYVVSQVLAGLALIVTLLVIWRNRSLTGDRRVAAAALFCFPLFIISAVGALLWALAFFAVRFLSSNSGPLDNWQRLYAGILDSLRYDLKLIEWGFAGLIGIVGAWLVVVAIVCWSHTNGAGSDPSTDIPNAGARARNGAVRALQFGAVGYVALVAVLAVLAAMKQHLGPTPSVLAIYVRSAFRVVPYLFLMVGPLSVVTGIVVDVLFYVADVKPLWTAEVLRNRFRTALAYAIVHSAPVAVVAHSQGSVIAVDVIGEGSIIPSYLFTAGSPIHSLYTRFLGSTPRTRAHPKSFRVPIRWTNFTRRADYIGAEQDKGHGTEFPPLDAGTHTGYWVLPSMWSVIVERLARTPYEPPANR